MIVMKFGGSSVGTGELMAHVARLIAEHNGEVAVVVSAMGNTTDLLFDAARQAERAEDQALGVTLSQLAALHRGATDDAATLHTIDEILEELASVLGGIRLLREQTPRSLDLIASVGERLSAPILAALLRNLGRAAVAVDARRFVVTGGEHGAARVDMAATRQAAEGVFRPVLEAREIPVVTGFLGATPAGITTTLGRGGSDYTAALVGNLLSADEIWIWTDVSGVYTADPRLVREARPLAAVSYREAAEMSYFGAKVLHPKTIGPAVEAAIPIRVKNTFEPTQAGTLVTAAPEVLPHAVKTVSSVHGLALVTIEGRGMSGELGVARRFFEATEAAHANVIMISQASSEQTISVVVSESDVEPLVCALKARFATELASGSVDGVNVVRGVAIASIVGQGMAGTPGISGKLFGALGSVHVNVLAIAQGGSEISISVAVMEEEAQRAVRAIHSAFGLTRVVNLMVLGHGKVGSAFLRQLTLTRGHLAKERGLELRLVGLATSSRFLFDEAGLRPEGALAAHGKERPSDEELIRTLVAARCTDLVLVDLTATDTTALQRRALAEGIHVVSANKRPLSGCLSDWDAAFEASRRSGALLAYETTFGAGLPVLHTLQELLATGDRVDRVSGCFSGTLGFLCSQLEQGMSFFAALAEAEAAGLTEPDPRDDLSGLDVARKALIIARTTGLRLEPEDVCITPFLPDLEHGLHAAIERHAAALETRFALARANGESLRYVAMVDHGHVEVGLCAVPLASPLGGLTGRDNMLVYNTARYHELPLVIRGPGAGAEVTAAGVLGDVLKVARR